MITGSRRKVWSGRLNWEKIKRPLTTKSKAKTNKRACPLSVRTNSVLGCLAVSAAYTYTYMVTDVCLSAPLSLRGQTDRQTVTYVSKSLDEGEDWAFKGKEKHAGRSFKRRGDTGAPRHSAVPSDCASKPGMRRSKCAWTGEKSTPMLE